MKVLALLLLSLSGAYATAYTVSQSGNTSSAATFGGAGVPGDGDTVDCNGAYTLTWNSDVASHGSGGAHNWTIRGGCQFKYDQGGTSHHFRFANGYGFVLNLGTWDIEAPSAAACAIVTASNETTEATCSARGSHDGGSWYISHPISVNVAASVVAKYVVGDGLGVGSAGEYGIYFLDTQGTSTISLSDSYFWATFDLVFADCCADYAGFAFDHVTVEGIPGGNAIYCACTNTPFTLTNSTFGQPTGNYFALNATSGTGATTVTGNAFFGSASYDTGAIVLKMPGGGAVQTVQYNLWASGTGGNSTYPAMEITARTTGTYLFDSNLIQSHNFGFQVAGATPLATEFAPLTNNVVIGNASVNNQGWGFIDYSGWAQSQGNIFVNAAQSGLNALFAYNSAGAGSPGTTKFTSNHDTVYGAGSGDTSNAIQLGDGGCATTNSTVTANTLIHNGSFMNLRTPINDFGENGVYATTLTWGGGVASNNNYGTGSYSSPCTGTTHYQSGATAHPNALYSDTQINPVYVDPSRTAEAYDKLIGGPGTAADLELGMAKRCGLLGTWDPRYDPKLVFQFVRAGMTPLNMAAQGTADDGTFTGAVQPYPFGATIP